MFFGQGKYVNLSHFTKTDTVVFSFYYIKSNNMSEVTITFDGFRYKRDIKGNIMNIGVL